MTRKRDPIVDEVVAAAGGVAAVADALGLSYQAVWQWRHVPVKHVLALEDMSNVPRERIRPDIYAERRASNPMIGVAAIA